MAKIVSFKAHQRQRGQSTAAVEKKLRLPVADVFVPYDPVAFASAKIEFTGFAHLQHMKGVLSTRNAEHLQWRFNGELDIMYAGDDYGSVVIGFDAHVDVRKLRQSLLQIGVDSKEWAAPPDMIQSFARSVLRSSLAVS